MHWISASLIIPYAGLMKEGSKCIVNVHLISIGYLASVQCLVSSKISNLNLSIKHKNIRSRLKKKLKEEDKILNS